MHTYISVIDTYTELYTQPAPALVTSPASQLKAPVGKHTLALTVETHAKKHPACLQSALASWASMVLRWTA
eukprot:4973483-Pyramimonas_sp.AAC.1